MVKSTLTISSLLVIGNIMLPKLRGQKTVVTKWSKYSKHEVPSIHTNNRRSGTIKIKETVWRKEWTKNNPDKRKIISVSDLNIKPKAFDLPKKLETRLTRYRTEYGRCKKNAEKARDQKPSTI